MKITPLEIRQKSFEKKLRGYDKDEVNAFLLSLSQEWERIQDENKELKINLDASKREVEKLREVESSLFKTLKTAEDTGANMIEQANKTAELHMKETQMKADAILNEAKSRAKTLQEQADYQAQKTIDDMENEMRELYQIVKSLESHRDDVIGQLRNLSNESLEKIQKFVEKSSALNIERFKASKVAPKENVQPQAIKEAQTVMQEPSEVIEEKKKKKDKEKKKEVVEGNSNASFFDEIG